MTKAEEAALKAYPRSEKYTSSLRMIINDMRDGFIQGYEQAEKDNELTWEDAQEICRIEYDMINNDPNDNPEWMASDKSFYEEVLRRLKNKKSVRENLMQLK